MQQHIPFSTTYRPHIVKKLSNTFFDLVVVGGGITGAGIALDAASRGLKVALVEKGDFASGTSSKSTKLIHGGLRYLKQFNFVLVREVGKERAVVHKIAPHLVQPEKMLLPLLKNGHNGKLLTAAGLKMYDWLANVKSADKRKMLTPKQAVNLEPLLASKKLIGAGYYAEYITDDSRLTLENIKTAVKYGATALNYTKVTGFIEKNGKVCGVNVIDVLNEQNYSIKGHYVVNATGPWVDDLRITNQPNQLKQLHITKGVHLVVKHSKLPVQQPIYFDVNDGRMIFAIPRGDVTYIGTTDTNYVLSKDKIEVTKTDVAYLLNAVAQMFTNVKLTEEDVISCWAGLRPLIHKKGKKPSELSRKDEIFIAKNQLISIAGGKLTGYRKMAERVVNTVVKFHKKQHKSKFKECHTHQIPLVGNLFTSFTDVKLYADKIYNYLKADGFFKNDAWYLISHYGAQTEHILRYYKTQKLIDNKAKLIAAECEFCIKNEMVVTPLDFFIRRTGRMYFNIASVTQYAPVVVNVFTKYFSLTKAQQETMLNEIHQSVRDHTTFV